MFDVGILLYGYNFLSHNYILYRLVMNERGQIKFSKCNNYNQQVGTYPNLYNMRACVQHGHNTKDLGDRVGKTVVAAVVTPADSGRVIRAQCFGQGSVTQF